MADSPYIPEGYEPVPSANAQQNTGSPYIPEGYERDNPNNFVQHPTFTNLIAHPIRSISDIGQQAKDDPTQLFPLKQISELGQMAKDDPLHPIEAVGQMARTDPLATIKKIGAMAKQPSSIFSNNIPDTLSNVATMASPYAISKGVLPDTTMDIADKPRIAADKLQKQYLSQEGITAKQVGDALAAKKSSNLPLVAADVMQKDELGNPSAGRSILKLISAAGNKPGEASQIAEDLIQRQSMQRNQIKATLQDVLSDESPVSLKDESLMQLHNHGRELQNTAFQAGSSGTPITSPTLESMIKDPIIKQGINSGIRTQQIRSLGNPLEPFEPNDYGVHGYDANGDMLISEHPNMRALDAGRQGLRAMYENEVDPTTGKVSARGAAIAEAASNYTNELKALNPAYKDYLEYTGEPLARQSALRMGEKFNSLSPDQVSDFLNGNSNRFKAGLSPILHDPASEGEKAFFNTGAMHNIADTLSKSNDDASVLDRTWKENTRDKLQHMVGPDNMAELDEFMSDQKAMMRSNRAFGGSNTFDKFAANQAIDEASQNKSIENAAKGIRFAASPHREALDFLGRTAQDMAAGKNTNMSNATAANIMRDYGSSDPQHWYNLSKRLGE